MYGDLYSIQEVVRAELLLGTGNRGAVRLGKPSLFSVAPQFGYLDLVEAQERETEGAQDQMLGDTPQLQSSGLQLVPGERASVGPEAL